MNVGTVVRGWLGAYRSWEGQGDRAFVSTSEGVTAPHGDRLTRVGDVAGTPGLTPAFSPRSVLGRVARVTAFSLTLALGGGLAVAGPVAAAPLATQSPVQDAGQDFGKKADVHAIKQLVAHRLGHPEHVSVSHDWATATEFKGQDDVSVLLHRSGGQWQIRYHDGGAFEASDLTAHGVPASEIPHLLRVYQ